VSTRRPGENSGKIERTEVRIPRRGARATDGWSTHTDGVVSVTWGGSSPASQRSMTGIAARPIAPLSVTMAASGGRCALSQGPSPSEMSDTSSGTRSPWRSNSTSRRGRWR
jgi:hypothetical protein